MIDRTARKRAAEILRKLALGKLSSWECENQLLDIPHDDAIIGGIQKTVSEIVGDRDHSLAYLFIRGGENRKRLCRWIFFLKTNLEYEWPQEREAPGIRDFYKPNLIDRILGLQARRVSSNTEFCSHGNYNVWPFLREDDFKAARIACAERRRAA